MTMQTTMQTKIQDRWTRSGAAWSCVLAALLLGACSDMPAGPADPRPTPAPIVVRTEPASTAVCPYGGSVVLSGIDVNRDGALQDAEVLTRAAVCNAMPAQPPPPILVRLVAEPPGNHCEAGGTAVQSGPDQNGNGRLDDAEVMHVDYACAEVLLKRIVAVPPGAQCPGGGIEFQSGRDRDGNGELDDGELEARALSCGDVVTGSMDIESDADMAAIANIRFVTGAIAVNGAKVHSISLPHLEHVGLELQAFGLALSGVELPALREVGGSLSLGGNGPIHCPELRRVGGLELATLGIADLGGFPALTEIAGNFRLTGMSSLVSVDLPNVAIRDNIQIDTSDHLAHISLGLVNPPASVFILENPSLETVDLSVAAQPPGSAAVGEVEIFLNDQLAHVALRADRVHSFNVQSNPAIGDVALDVARFDLGVSLFGITTPYRLTLSSPSPDGLEIGGDAFFTGPLFGFDATAAVRVAGACQFQSTQLEALDLTHPMEVGEVLVLADNPLLAQISPITLTGGLEVTGNALLSNLDFVSPAVPGELGEVLITDNPVLASASSLDPLVVAHGPVDIERNPRLAGVFGPSLTKVAGALTVTGNAGLTALSLPGLQGGVTDLVVHSNAALQSVELPALTAVTGGIDIAANAQLHHIAFDALGQATDLSVTDNPHLPACEVLAVFAHVAATSKQQSGNDDTATCP